MSANSEPSTQSDSTPGAEERIEVRQNEPVGRFEIIVDNVLAGFADYQDEGTVRAFPHTVVSAEFGGRGLGGRLVRAALDESRKEGMTILPHCSFVATFIEKHPEYADLVAGQ